MPSWLVILLIVLGSLLGLFLIIFFVNGAILTHLSFRRRPGDATFAEDEDPEDRNAPDRLWFFSQRIKQFEMKSYDGLKLKGYFLDNNSNKLAIMVHGYHGRYYSTVSQARIFYENGFDVFAMNHRCHDTSEGKLTTMGQNEVKDLAAWVEFMLQKNPNYQIVLYGISMGGHIVMLYGSSTNVNQNIKCIVEDCGYNSLKKELTYMVKLRTGRFEKFIVNLGQIYSKIFYHFSYTNTVEKSFKNLKLPILLIHGGADGYVPTSNVYEIEKAIPKDVYHEMHVFEGVDHTRCVVDRKDDFRIILNNFVDKFVK